jgi:uncharacterized membrane protein
MDASRENALAHRNIERGGIVLGVGLVIMIASFILAVHVNELVLFGALVGWFMAVLGAIWLTDGMRHHYAARRAATA